MQQRQELPAGLIERAARQGYVVTAADFRAFGVSRRVGERLVREGAVVRVLRGAYHLRRWEPDVSRSVRQQGRWARPHLTDVFDAPLRARIWAAHLVTRPSALGGWHALALEGVRVDPRRLAGDVVMWTTKRSLAPRDGCVFSEDHLGRLRIAQPGRGAPPLIDVSDALIDVCRDLTEADALALALDVMRSAVVPAWVAAALQRRERVPHRAMLTAAVAGAADGMESILEHHFVHRVERPHGLPKARRQKRLPGGRADAWYREFRVAVELDGDRFHDPRRDRDRDNRNAAHGIETRRFGWYDITVDACRTARLIGQVLQQRGWAGTVRACPSCRSEGLSVPAA